MPAKGVTVTKEQSLARQKEVLELKKYCFSYAQIATFMHDKYGTLIWDGYDERSVAYDVKKALAREAKEMHETAKEVVQMDLKRLDEMINSIYTRAISGDLKAIDRILKIMKHRSNLLGLEQPKSIKISDWRTEILDLIRTGNITIEQVKETLGNEQYEEIRGLIEPGGSVIVESGFVETESIEVESD